MNKKLTVNTLALGNLRQRKKQYTLMIIGIILAMIFASGVPFFISCMNSSQLETRQRRQGKQDYIVVNAQKYDLDSMAAQGYVDEVGYCHTLFYAWNEKADLDDGTMIGWLDEKAQELYYLHTVEGRMPEKEGEIAFEKSALTRMKLDKTVGDKIKLKALSCNAGDFLPDTIEKEYTIVGILGDKKSNLEHLQSSYLQKAALLPAAFVAKNSQTELGGKEALVAFVNPDYTDIQYNLFWENIPYDDKMQTNEIFSVSVGDDYSNIANNTFTLSFLSVLVAFLSCFGIVNTFNTNLKERKAQVGMLKAVGATRRQIINIFGREAFIICLLSAPLSVAASYGGVKLFARLMGENFVFKPDIAVLLIGALFGIICVMLSALIPLWSISKLPPMQAIRDIELMRKMKNKKIKSQKQFNVSRLLAKRKLTFSKGRQVSVCVIICLSIVVCCISMSFLFTTLEETDSFYASDYEIAHHGSAGSANTFINYKDTNSPITENDIYGIYDLPQVANVYGQKSIKVNLVFKDGNVPEYLQINEYMQYAGISSRYIDANDVLFSRAMEEYESGAGGFDLPEEIELTRENIKEVMQAEPNPNYTYTKQVAGFADEELFNTGLTAKSAKILTFTENEIIDGKINYEKLNKGEEVIVYAPEKIGYSYEKTSGGGYSSGLYNLSRDVGTDSLRDNEMRDENVYATAESPFKVGDTLTISIISSDAAGNITREDRDVKIGAIVGKNTLSGNFNIYTTTEGLSTFKSKFDYFKLDVELKEECTAEIDEVMQSELSALFPGKNIGSAFAFNEGQEEDLRTTVVSIASLILVMLAVCISLINNSISAQIREGKRSIGTLRAVGASEKELVLSYVMQIATVLLWGLLSGTVIYILSYRFIGKIVIGEYWPVVIWPAFLVFGIIALCCYINLKAKIKAVTKYSIVENIRELG